MKWSVPFMRELVWQPSQWIQAQAWCDIQWNSVRNRPIAFGFPREDAVSVLKEFPLHRGDETV